MTTVDLEQEQTDEKAKKLELSEDLVDNYGILDVFYTSEKIEITLINVDEYNDTIILPVRERSDDTLNQLDTFVPLTIAHESCAYLKYYLTLKLKPIWNEICIPNNETEKEKIDISELESKIGNRGFLEYVKGIAKRTVKCEDSLVRQIFLTALSSYSKDPINLAIIAPTSEGKTYPVMEALKYFPKEDVLRIGAMSTKYLVRDHGILVDGNNNPIEAKIKELESQIKLAQSQKEDRQYIEALGNQLNSLKENSRTLIDLSNKIIVFLEPPQEQLWNLLKPILSHDSYEIEFPYVDKDIVSKKVVARGWPSFIVCSAKDESRWPIWPKIQSRFLITSPNMIPEKYLASNILIAQKKGLPNLIQQQVIVSDEEIELAKKCVLFLKGNMQLYKENKVWIPYSQILSEILPSNKGTTNRITDRIFSFLNVMTLVNAHCRSRLTVCDETSIVAVMDDLGQVLSMTQNLNGVPSHKMKIFNEIVWPCYEEKTEPIESIDGIKRERRKAVTSRELVDFYIKTYNKQMTVDTFKKTFLNELMNNDLVEQEVSQINSKQYIYYPIGEKQESEITTSLSKSDNFDKNLQHSRIAIPKNLMEIPENWLILEILSFLACRNPKAENELIQLKDIQFYDEDGNKQCIREFYDRYYSDKLIRYTYKLIYCNFHCKIFGAMQLLDQNARKGVNTISSKGNFDIKDINYRSKTQNQSQIHTQVKKKCPYCNHEDQPFFLKVHVKNAHGIGVEPEIREVVPKWVKTVSTNKRQVSYEHDDVRRFINRRIPIIQAGDKITIEVSPTIGILSIQNNFLSGNLSLRGKGGDRYAYDYLDFINDVFGYVSPGGTIEVCSNEIAGLQRCKDEGREASCYTVDINPKYKPDLVKDGQTLEGLGDNSFYRWRCEPPYNEKSAKEMHDCQLPSLSKLLKAGARVLNPDSLMFLLCTQDQQPVPEGIKKIGIITISIIPTGEIRVLNIYVKLPEEYHSNE